MKKYYIYLLGLFLFFCIISIYKEGYINIYESNEFLKNKPAFIHHYECKDDEIMIDRGGIIDERVSFQKFPNSYYILEEKGKKEGAFSSFLDIYGFRPIHTNRLCDSIYETENQYKSIDFNNQFRLIPGAFPEEDINKIYKDELIKDKMDFNKQLYSFSNIEDSEKSIIYNDDIQENILKMRLDKNLYHEDNRHLVNDHQYQGTHD